MAGQRDVGAPRFRARRRGGRGDLVAVACAAPVVVVMASSPLGAFVVSASQGLGIPTDGGLSFRVDVVSGGVDHAPDALAGDGQLQRALRGQGLGPLRILRRVEPAIIAHRDAAGRIALHTLPQPAAVPAPALLEPAALAPKRRRQVAEPAAG